MRRPYAKRDVTLYLVETTTGAVIIEDVPVTRCIKCGRKAFAPEVLDQITALLVDIEHGRLELPQVRTGRVQYAHPQRKASSQ